MVTSNNACFLHLPHTFSDRWEGESHSLSQFFVGEARILLQFLEQAPASFIKYCGEQAYRIYISIDIRDGMEEQSVTILDEQGEVLLRNGIFFPNPPSFENYVLLPEPGFWREDDSEVQAELANLDGEEFFDTTQWQDEGIDPDLIAHLNALDSEAAPLELDEPGGLTLPTSGPSPFTLFPPFDMLYADGKQPTRAELIAYLQNGEHSHGHYWLSDQPTISFSTVYLKEGEQYRRILNREEIILLGKMYLDSMNWERVHTIIRKTHGEKAAIAVVRDYAEYDDDGGYYRLTALENVYDRDGNVLSADPNLPYWQEVYQQTMEWAFADISQDDAEWSYGHVFYKNYMSRFSSFSEWAQEYISYNSKEHMRDILHETGVYMPITCHLNQPPPVPPTIYTDISESSRP